MRAADEDLGRARRELVANGMTPQQIVVDLPDLDLVDVRQALGYAAALAKDELHPLRA